MLKHFCSPSLLNGAARRSFQRQSHMPSSASSVLFCNNNVKNNYNISNNTNSSADMICRYRSNRSKRGLYDGKDIRSGNNVSFSMKSTKRKIKPNVFVKRVYSEVLDEMLKFHLTTSALRSIDNAGGLDNYLLTSKHVTSGEGLVAKKRIVKALKGQGKQNTNNQQQQQQQIQQD